MKLLIYGATETGYMIARRLFQEHNVSLMDNLKTLPDKFNNLDISLINGSAADVVALHQAGIDKMDLFIACQPLDEANIVACWTVKKIIDIEVICFVHTRELYDNLTASTANPGRHDIDTVIWPQQLLSQDIFRIILVPEALDVEYFAGGRVKLFEYRIKGNSKLINTRVKDAAFPVGVLIVGITRDHELFIPDGATTILYDDKVIFMGTGPALGTLAANIFHTGNRMRTAVLIGGGSVGFLLAGQLEQAGIRVKLIEQDSKRCDFLTDHLSHTLILHGNGTDLDLLEEELVGQADVVVSVTNNDEKNLLCSLLVKELGCGRIITRAENAHSVRIFEKVGIDVVVSPRASALTELLNRIQARNVNVLALVEDGQGEVLRLTLPDDFPETKVMDLHFGAKAVIGIVQRGRRILIPHGGTVLRAGDWLKVFTMARDADQIKGMFSR